MSKSTRRAPLWCAWIAALWFPTSPLLAQLPQDFQFKLSGYFRAPLRVGVQEVDGETDLHSPWLADGNYASFNYTRLQEADWAEIFLNVGTPRVTATVGLMAWLFSGSQSNTDAFRPGQLGIAHAYLTFHVPAVLGPKSDLEVQAGTFWDRYGYVNRYDTYMFGRLHQMGEHVKLTLPLGYFDLMLLHGFGTYRENNLSAAPDGGPKRGFTLLNQAVAVLAHGNTRFGGYFIDSWTRDARTDNGQGNDRLRVVGADLSFSHDLLGSIYAAGSVVHAQQALEVAPVIEVLHSFGPAGITQNYLGGSKGTVYAASGLYEYSFGKLRRALRGKNEPVTRDTVLGVFGMFAHVDSETAASGPVGNGTDKLKVGGDLTQDILDWLSVSGRYDWVSEQLSDSGRSFQVVSPRITFRTQWLAKEQLFLQYSRYFYGDDVRAPEGDTAPLGMRRPDDHVFKLQAQIGL